MGIQVIQSSTGGSVARLQLLNGVTLSSSLVAIADQNNNPSFLKLSTSNISLEAPTFLSLLFDQTGGTRIGFSASQTLNVPTAGNGVFRMISNSYTINNLAAQTGSITGYYLNATETALNGITHNLIDLQVGGGTRFKVLNNGLTTIKSSSNTGATLVSIENSTLKIIDINDRGTITGTAFNSANNVYRLGFSGSFDAGSLQLFAEGNANGVFFAGKINTENYIYNNLLIGTSSSAIIKLGGTTNLFPAIKRNGASIDFRLADDSGFCNIQSAQMQCVNGYINTVFAPTLSDGNGVKAWAKITNTTAAVRFETTNLFADSGTINASARVQIDSTTQGFLMPRMTEAQILAIATPANGLMVYNTTQLAPCFYDSTGWKRLVHLAM